MGEGAVAKAARRGGDAEEALEPPTQVREGGRKGKGAWPSGPSQPAGPLGAKRPDGCWAVWAKVEGKIISEEKLDFEYIMALEIYIRRFWRNFDTEIFPKFV
jgi:hypothetical protein